MRPIDKYTYPALVVTGWVVILLVIANLISGCQPQERPSTFNTLTTAESTITAGATTLKRALDLGTITTDDPDYATAYDGLHRAGEAMDLAWAAYRAGQLGDADASRRSAMETYALVRPILVRLGEEQ